MLNSWIRFVIAVEWELSDDNGIVSVIVKFCDVDT